MMKKTNIMLYIMLIFAMALSFTQITAFASDENDAPVVTGAWFCDLIGDADYPSSSDSAIYKLAASIKVSDGSTESYIEENSPYISLTLDGRSYNKVYFVYDEKRDCGSAAAVLFGYGDFKGSVCANEDDTVSVAKSSDAAYDSTFTLNSYEGGMRIKSSVILDSASGEAIWKELSGMPSFKDVNPEDWFYKHVIDTYKAGLLLGETEEYFKPYNPITYAETITLAARLHALLYETTIDVSLNNSEIWYQPYLNYASENGILYEFDDYNAEINRRDFVKIMFDACSPEKLVPVIDDAEFKIPDVEEGSDSADRIYAFYRAGILSGMDAEGSFCPDLNIKRSEVSAIISRIIK